MNLNRVLENVATRSQAADIEITDEQVNRALKNAFTPRLLRTIERSRLQIRREIWGLARSAAPEFEPRRERTAASPNR